MTKTPNQKWAEEISENRKKCQRLLLVSPSIRYVGLINQYGRTLTGILKKDAKPLLKPNQVRDEFFLVSTLLSLRSKNYEGIGGLQYAIFKHSKVTIVVFGRKEGTYYVSVDAQLQDAALSKIINDLNNLV